MDRAWNWCGFALALLMVACGGGDGPPPDVGPGARLEFVSSPTVNLMPSEQTELVVRYVGEGEFAGGIPNANLDWSIVGAAGGSRLSAGVSVTDDNGQSSIRLTAGSSDTTFRVRVTPPEGDAIEFSVGVASFDAGSILVELEYAGERMFNPIEALLFEGLDCGSFDPTMPPTALQQSSVPSLTARPAFNNVPVGLDYSVAVIARMSGVASAYGCVENVRVDSGEQTTVTVTLMDLAMEPRIVGVYDLDNRLDFAGTLPGAVGTAVDVLDELTDDNDVAGNPATEDFGQDPGAFVVDFAMRQTCAWECMPSEDYDTCSIGHPYGDISALYLENFTSWEGARSRFTGGCGAWETAGEPAQDLVNDQLESLLPGFVLKLADSLGDVARSINEAHIESRLIVFEEGELGAPVRHELQAMNVTIRDLDGMPHDFRIDLREAGFTSVATDATAEIVDGVITIPEHSFTLSYGELIQYIYNNALLPALGYMSTAEMLSGWIDCAAIGMWLASNIGILSETDYTNACNSGLVAAGAFIDSQLGSFITDADGTLSLAGMATGADYDSVSNIAQSLNNGMWTGSWGEMGMSGDITGTFTGTRTADPPAR